MTRLLLCSYFFPPIGGAGAQRPTKFAQHFDAMGHACTVVTGPGRPRTRWTPADPTLLGEVPESVRVLRVPYHEPELPSSIQAKAERWFPIGGTWRGWWADGIVETGIRAAADTEVVYTIMSPFESAEASRRLAQRLRVPWIADLGDPWALDEMAVYPTGLHRRWERRRMRQELRSAAAIIMSTPEAAAELLREFPELANRPVVSITNGYDAADLQAAVPPRTNDSVFRIVHTGYLHTELGLRQQRIRHLRKLLGGQLPGVEILTRSHVYLLQALQQLLADNPDLQGRLELVLAGVLSSVDHAAVGDLPFVHTPGYLSHAESLALVRTADLLFLPMQKLPPGRRSTTVPGKTYEYIASGRPILAAVPDGDARDFLQAARTAQICNPDDTTAMKKAIEQQIRRWERGEDPPAPNPEIVRRFEYHHLATQAGQLAERVVQEHRAYRPHRLETTPGRPLRALMLLYYFPPTGGAGAQRTSKLVGYLDRTRYEPIVVAGPGSAEGRWTPQDETMVDDIPPGTQVLRIPAPEPRSSHLRARFERWVNTRSGWAAWWEKGVLEAARQVGEFDLVLASMAPFDSARVAARLTARHGVPWIADLRDPWALDEMAVYPTGLHRRWERRRMRQELRSAAAIIMSTPEAAAELLREFPELANRPVVSITNGYDAADLQAAVPPRTNDSVFRIVHTGYLHTELGLRQQRIRHLRKLLGGQLPGVEILTRSHVYLLQALQQLLADNPDLQGRLELVLAGVLSSVDHATVGDLPFVHTPGYLSHAESLALVRTADLLFLPMQKLPPGRRSTTVPGKTYEYIASGRPILAAVPDGDARDFLQAARTAQICNPDDTTAMKKAIEQQIRRWERGEDPPAPNRQMVERFDRRRIAEDFAQVFDDLLDVGAASATHDQHTVDHPATGA